MTVSTQSATIPHIDPTTIIERLAKLVVSFGANIQKGQTLTLGAELGNEQIVRAITAAAYKQGAGFVDVTYSDPHIKKARVEYADPNTIDHFPSWSTKKCIDMGEQRCAVISIAGTSEPHLLDQLDPSLVGKEQSADRKEYLRLVNESLINWSIIPSANAGWAKLVFPELNEKDALAKLWQELAWICRLDADDPVALWQERMQELKRVASELQVRNFDAIHLEGPGTDLTVGLLPTSEFICADMETIDGIRHMPNIPSEEIFTTPDPKRVDGVVRATKPLFTAGSLIEGLEVEFREGKVVRIDADKNADTLRSLITRDEGASRLGELALVDGLGRVGATDTVYYTTLLDENAASHIALGAGYTQAVGDADKDEINQSVIHIDFMIGSSDVTTWGIGKDGSRTRVLANGEWHI